MPSLSLVAMKLQFTKQAREEFLNHESGIDPSKIVAESVENNRENAWFSRYFFVIL